MSKPTRLAEQAGRYSLVDGIPFHLPVSCQGSPVLMAVFTIDPAAAQKLIPGNEIFPFRFGSRALLVVTVVDYLKTTIGRYIEFSLALACTHGSRRAPPFLPALLQSRYGFGQFVYDLPVSTDISVKGGKGIWGMPKHQANLDYTVGDKVVSGQPAIRIEIDRPKSAWLPLSMTAVNFCAFRGMLFKSSIYFTGRAGFTFKKKGAARLMIGTHPRVQALRALDIDPEPLATVFVPAADGVLDDHIESWFLSSATPPAVPPEGMESVVNLGLSQQWLPPPAPWPKDLPPL
jgi:hypothetical protein